MDADWILAHLSHEPGCHGAQGSHSPGLGASYALPCTCRRREALEELEKMGAFVEAFRNWLAVESEHRIDFKAEVLKGEMMTAFARLEGE